RRSARAAHVRPAASAGRPGPYTLSAPEFLLRELPEPLARFVVRAERLVVRVLRIGGDLLCEGAHLSHERVVVRRVLQQRVDPRLTAVVRRQIVVEEQLAEQQSDTDVRERAEGEDP